MAEQTSFPKERLEDVFQDEIIKAFVNITSFEKFARSKNGLCLDQANIQTIVEDHGGNVEKQKMEMCFKWREIQGEKATVPNIRHLLQKFFRKDNPSDYIVLENGIFGVYKTRFLCERSNVYLGVQISEVTGPQTRAIKIVPKNEKHLREAQILAKLGNHVNVVSIIHAGIHKGDPQDYIYIAMEHSWTQTVRNMIEEWIKLQKQGKPFHEFIAWSLVEQLMRAVEFLHSHNIIHRDLKPDNILASDDWRFFKVTDYGLSKEVKDGYATIQTNAYIGTEGYRSLETYDPNAKITAKADMFSAGATIGEIMANGKHPFGEDPDLWTHNIKNNKNLDLRHLRVSYKVEVTYFIKRMLEMDPEKRPTAKEVLNDVSIYFQTFQLKNQQSTAGQSLATASKAMSELSITDKRKKATVPKIRNFYKTMQKYFRKDNSSVLTGTTADESLASTSKAMTELSITEKVNAIIMFNWEEMHLFSFELSSKKWNPMQEFYKYDSWDATVVSGKHIYILHNREVHQLEYSDPAAEWKKMSSMIENHGSFPSAAVSNGLIYVCGSSFQYASGKEAYRSVERYDVAQDRWDHMCSMNIGKTHPVVVATEDYVYCMGDCDIRRDQSVERFDTNLNKWEIVRSSPRATSNVSAAVVKNRIYTADTKGVLYYNIQNDSWRIIHLTSQWPFMKEVDVKILAIDEELYIIGPIDEPKKKGRKAIYLFNPETKQMTLVEKFKGNGIHYVSNCLAVKF